MLKDHELEQIFVELALPEEARKLIRLARETSPVRRAQSRLGNSIVRLFSRKMDGKHLELESRTVETPAAVTYENDPKCLEFWPQPFTVDLILKDENGTASSRVQHTPDFLIVTRNSIFIDEWREEARLIRLASERPHFFKDDSGRWHYGPAEQHFEHIGLQYNLRSAFEHPRTFIQNIRFLEDYLLPECPPLPEDVGAALRELLAEHGSVPFLDILNNHKLSADHVFKAIAENVVAVDLYAVNLHSPSDLVIHRDQAVARVHAVLNKTRREAPLPIPGMAKLSAGARIRFDGKDYEVILVGGGQTLLRDTEGNRITLPIKDVEAIYSDNQIVITNAHDSAVLRTKSVADFSKEQLDTATGRLDAITNRDTSKVSVRTLQRWQEKTAGAVSRLDQLLALTDDSQNKGNRTGRLPEEVEKLAEEAIRNHYNTPECRTALATYNKYQSLCDDRGIHPMSYPTFTMRVKVKKSTKGREGKRKAYQEAPIPLFLDYLEPVHGVRPHEVCYMDHTVVNLATVGPEGSELGKPILTLGVDGNTTQSRAFYLSYDPPSVRAVLMTLRDYVRRHKRLPRILVVDGGKEFRSRELEWFCSLYGIDLRYRPPGMPRGGSPVERALGAAETEVIAQMEGNTRIMKNVRMVTKSVNPFDRAVWTLTALHGALEEYFFDIRENRIHPTLGSTPRDYEAMRMAETGVREHVFVKFDENIMLMTSPHTMRRFHKIDRIRGAWADNQYYWHDDFRSSKKSEPVEVRVEPWNANIIYVYFRDRWLAAIARDLRAFGNRTRYEVELAVRAERRAAKINATKDRRNKVNSRKLLSLWTPDKFDERIGKQQREMIHLYSRLNMTVAMPAEAERTKKPGYATEMTPVSLHPDKPATVAEPPTLPSLEAPATSTKESTHSAFWGGSNEFV